MPLPDGDANASVAVMTPPVPAVPRPRRWALWLLLLTGVWAVGTMWLFSDGAISVYLDMVWLYLGTVVIGTAAIATLVASSAGQDRTRRRRRLLVPLALTGLIMAVVPSLCRYDMPFSTRFARSEKALLAAVQSKPLAATTPRWIGWLHVRQVDDVGGTLRFTTGGCGVSARCGIAHNQHGRPEPTEGASYKPLRGPWWAFEQR